MATKLSSPWVRLYRELQAMFKDDKDIKVLQDGYDVKVYVDSSAKADALTQLLNPLYVFGNVKSNVIVVPGNKEGGEEGDIFEIAFKDNPALSYVYNADTVLGYYRYVVFANKVVQYFNDDLGDVNGNCSTLYQEIAKNIFVDKPHTFFCTDTPDRLGKPLGEWP